MVRSKEKIICHICEKEDFFIETTCNYKKNKDMPYRWSEIHRKTADVHDSACMFFESDLYLCPECTKILM